MRYSLLKLAGALVLLYGMAPPWAVAQEKQSNQATLPSRETDAGQSAAAGPQESFSEPLSPPPIASGVRPSLTLGAEGSRTNFITANLQLLAAYDGNVLSSSTQRVSDVSYLLAPGLTMAQTRERWDWLLAYNPGFTVNQRFQDRNQSAHNLSADIAYRFSPHVVLRMRDTFAKTTSLFSQLFSSAATTGFGPLQQANSSLITPLNRQTGNTSSADFSYQFNASSTIGVGATYYFVNFDQIASTNGVPTSLIDSRSLMLNASYGHQFSNKQWLGTSYDFQQLHFQFGTRTTIQRLLLFYSVPLRERVIFSLWAGPEYSRTDAAANFMGLAGFSGAHWSGAGGASLTWQGQHNGFRTEFTRRISDGGGLTQAVVLQQASAEVQRQLSKRWSTNLGVNYANNDPLNPFVSSLGRVRVLSATAGLNWALREYVAIGMNYGRDRQEYPQSPARMTPANRNRGAVSLSYSFTRPLGR